MLRTSLAERGPASRQARASRQAQAYPPPPPSASEIRQFWEDLLCEWGPEDLARSEAEWARLGELCAEHAEHPIHAICPTCQYEYCVALRDALCTTLGVCMRCDTYARPNPYNPLNRPVVLAVLSAQTVLSVKESSRLRWDEKWAAVGTRRQGQGPVRGPGELDRVLGLHLGDPCAPMQGLHWDDPFAAEAPQKGTASGIIAPSLTERLAAGLIGFGN